MYSYNISFVRNCIVHAKRRAYERYKLALTDFDIFQISSLVLEGNAILKGKRLNRYIYKVAYAGRNLVVVFDKIQLIVVTFLPHSALMRFC